MKVLVFCSIVLLSLVMTVAAAPRAHELEGEILRIIRSDETPDGTWRAAVINSNNEIVAAVGAVWDILAESAAGAEGLATNRNANYTVITQGRAEGGNYHNANPLGLAILEFIGTQRINTGNITTVNDISHIGTLQNGLVYIGRPTCPACVPFSRTLFDAVISSGAQVYYLNTDMWRGHPQFSQVITTRFGVSGVPFLASVTAGEISVIPYRSYADLVGALNVFATTGRTLRFVINNPTFTDNGVSRRLEAAPFIAQDRTMVPLRVIAEALGATNLGLNNNVVTFTLGGTTHNLQIGQPLAGGIGTPVIVEGRTFVPLRYVINVLGTGYRWDAVNQAAYIII